MRSRSVSYTGRSLVSQNVPTKWANVLLWILQGLLSVLFLFAGVAKLAMPVEALTSLTGLPGLFMKFIAVAEMAGGLGLVLPHLLHLRHSLIPLAAAGLVPIMIGAVLMTIAKQGVAPATFPLVIGLLLTLVIRYRRQHSTIQFPGVASPSRV